MQQQQFLDYTNVPSFVLLFLPYPFLCFLFSFSPFPFVVVDRTQQREELAVEGKTGSNSAANTTKSLNSMLKK